VSIRTGNFRARKDNDLAVEVLFHLNVWEDREQESDDVIHRDDNGLHGVGYRVRG